MEDASGWYYCDNSDSSSLNDKVVRYTFTSSTDSELGKVGAVNVVMEVEVKFA